MVAVPDPEEPALAGVGIIGASERTTAMTRFRRIVTCLIAATCLATGAVAEEKLQPPRGARDPDRARPAGARPRYGFSAFGGFRALQVDSRLFDANEVEFGLTEDDFRSGRLGFELDYALLPMLEIVVGFDTGEAETDGNYLDLVYEDGSEIEHSARLRLTDYTIGVRVRPFRLGRASPYVVFGVARTSYDYFEEGEFVNFENFDIYYDELEERVSFTGFFAGAGFDFAVVRMPFGRRLDVFGEFRYARGEGGHRDEFADFGDLGVARLGALFGIRVRF